MRFPLGQANHETRRLAVVVVIIVVVGCCCCCLFPRPTLASTGANGSSRRNRLGVWWSKRLLPSILPGGAHVGALLVVFDQPGLSPARAGWKGGKVNAGVYDDVLPTPDQHVWSTPSVPVDPASYQGETVGQVIGIY